MSERERRPAATGWTIAWMLWILGFLAVELPAAMRERPWTVRTLSVHVWRRWAPRMWQRALFAIFGVEVFVLHFMDGGRHWWSGGWAVMVTGCPVAVLVVWRERGMLTRIGRWLRGAASVAWVFTKKRGPILTNVIGGVAIAYPQLGTLAAVLSAIAGGGDIPGGQAIAEAVGALTLSTFAWWRSAVKTISVIKAAQTAG